MYWNHQVRSSLCLHVLCSWLCLACACCRKDSVTVTLRAPLSGTFLQTLPDLVINAIEGSLFISAQLSTDAVSALRKVRVLIRLQALVYDIHPSTTVVFSYAIGPRKLSANEQFFVGAETVVILLQTTRIISDVCFVTDHVTYAS